MICRTCPHDLKNLSSWSAEPVFMICKTCLHDMKNLCKWSTEPVSMIWKIYIINDLQNLSPWSEKLVFMIDLQNVHLVYPNHQSCSHKCNCWRTMMLRNFFFFRIQVLSNYRINILKPYQSLEIVHCWQMIPNVLSWKLLGCGAGQLLMNDHHVKMSVDTCKKSINESRNQSIN